MENVIVDLEWKNHECWCMKRDKERQRHNRDYTQSGE